jgi:hypothetical protein
MDYIGIVNYHLNKTEECIEKGIHLIHIYEDDWIYKKDIIKSRILNLLHKNRQNFYARKCYVKEITSNSISKTFLDQNHMQGNVNSKVKLGLYHKNKLSNEEEMIAIMTFGKSRFEKDTYELYRFCNKLGYNAVGGAGKLFKYFLRNYIPSDIISYADRSWSIGNLYEQLGFKLINKTAPNYHYIKDNIQLDRFGFRKSELIKAGFDSNYTEHQIMQDQKVYRIYDSGNLKYQFNR